jgi:hypothetical protein
MSHGHNTEFLKDPLAYLRSVTVLTVGTQFFPSIDGFKTQVAKSPINMDLITLDSGVKSGSKMSRADFCLQGKGGDSDIVAGWIPYVDEGTVNQDIGKLPALELPPGGTPKFAFTGAMNGCSLVLATKGGKNYGIHVPNSSQAKNGNPALTQAGYTYVKSIDYFQLGQLRQGHYGTKIGASRDAPGGGWYNTFAFFYFDNGGWTIVAQPQIVTLQGLGSDTKSGAGVSYVAKTSGDIIQI